MGMAVRSEVGKLRKVMVHRPGLEHTRLTPENASDLLFDHALNERMVGINGSQRAREWITHAPPAEVADFLIGGITAQDLREGKQFFGAFDPTEILLPPLPNFMFQRDPSCWI